MTVRKVFGDNQKETYCLVQEPGKCVITADAFVFGAKNGFGVWQSRGIVTFDFGEGIGKMVMQDFEVRIKRLPKKEKP